MHGDVQIMKDKKIKALMISEICIGIFCVTILVCLLCLRGRGDISLAYLLLLIFMVIIMAAVGFIIVLMYKLTLQNKENIENYANIEQRILSLEEHNKKDSKKKEIISVNSQNILSITQSQLSNHIASVNTTMLVMSIVCVFITIAIPILNYAFLNAEQIENMYANVDEKMETVISDMQDQVENTLLDEKKELQDEIDSVLYETIAQLETEMKVTSETTLFQAQLNSLEFGEPNEKINRCTMLILQYPNRAEPYYFRGYIYYQRRDYNNAISDLTKAKELGYENLDSLDQILCYSYSNLGDEFSVIDICNSHIPEEDYICLFTYIRAQAYTNLGLFEEAEKEYLCMISELENGNHYIYPNYWAVGDFYNKWGKYEEALIWYEKGIEEYPDKDAYLSRGNLYLQREQYDFALEDFSKVIEISPDQHYGYERRAEVYYKMGSYNLALDDINAAIVLLDSPKDFISSYNRRGEIYMHLKEYDRAVDDFRIVVAVNDNNGTYVYNLGAAYYYTQEYEEAIRYLTKAMEINPNTKWSYYYRSKAYEALGEMDLSQLDMEVYNSRL